MAASFEMPDPQATRRDPIYQPPDSVAKILVIPTLIGCAVTLAIGLYARLHHATGIAVNIAGFSSPGSVKAWLATVAAVLALVQVGSVELDPNAPAPTAQPAPPLDTTTLTANDGGVTLHATPIDAETGSGF